MCDLQARIKYLTSYRICDKGSRVEDDDEVVGGGGETMMIMMMMIMMMMIMIMQSAQVSAVSAPGACGLQPQHRHLQVASDLIQYFTSQQLGGTD